MRISVKLLVISEAALLVAMIAFVTPVIPNMRMAVVEPDEAEGDRDQRRAASRRREP